MDVYIIIFDIMLSSLVLLYVLYVLHVVVVEFIVHIQPTCTICTDMEKNIDGRGVI